MNFELIIFFTSLLIHIFGLLFLIVYTCAKPNKFFVMLLCAYALSLIPVLGGLFLSEFITLPSGEMTKTNFYYVSKVSALGYYSLLTLAFIWLFRSKNVLKPETD